jgi:integrase/recombinase XerD
MHIKDAVQEWLIAIEAEGKRPDTISSYRSHMVPIFRALPDIQDINSLSVSHTRRWMIEYQKTHSAYSLRSVFITYRAFIHWCQREKLIASDPLLNVKQPKASENIKPTFSQGQIKALFALLTSNRTPLFLRNAAIIAVLMDTGLRATEVCHLTLSDWIGDTLLVRRTKSGRPRLAFLGKRGEQMLSRYLALGRPKLKPKDEWMFISKQGTQLTRNTIRCLLVRLSTSLGFPLNAHKFRHSWATIIASNGANAMQLRDLAGWQSIEMAQRYVHLNDSNLREVHQKIKPLDNIF